MCKTKLTQMLSNVSSNFPKFLSFVLSVFSMHTSNQAGGVHHFYPLNMKKLYCRLQWCLHLVKSLFCTIVYFIVPCFVFINTSVKSLILFDIVRYCWIFSDIVRFCQILSDVVRYCQILLDIVRSCEILLDIFRNC